MNPKTIKILLICVSLILAIFIYRALFIKTVNFTIGAIDIPSKYNVITGKTTPIANYTGKMPKRTVTDQKTDNIGLDSQNVEAAKFRWELFEGWAKSQPQYKGWESDPALFQKANEDFQKKVPARVQVLE